MCFLLVPSIQSLQFSNHLQESEIRGNWHIYLFEYWFPSHFMVGYRPEETLTPCTSQTLGFSCLRWQLWCSTCEQSTQIMQFCVFQVNFLNVRCKGLGYKRFSMYLWCAYQCCSRRQRWGLKDSLHMAPFKIHCNTTLWLNCGVFNNSRAKQVESGTAFNGHLEVFMDISEKTLIHTGLQKRM